MKRPAASPAKQLAAFLAKYTPQMVASATATRTRLRKHLPGGVECVYDNYNWLVIGYGPTERPSQAVLSLALAPQWVTLCFLKGAGLSDPKKLLKGGGSTVRHIRLDSPSHVDEPDVASLIRQAVGAATPAFPTSSRPRTIIKSVSAKQRSRRPR